MDKSKWPIVILISNVLVISLVILLYVNRTYPMIGLDYSYVIPQMVDGFLHFQINGPSIQWYTASFGGGTPAFPDPNNFQFSLLTTLSLFMQSLTATMVSTVFFIALGSFASYYFFSRILKLHWTSSILGTVFFNATGFYLERMAIGHINYQTFPLLAVLFVLLLDSALPRRVAGVIFAILVAIIIQQIGYVVIITFALSLLITFPLLYIYRPEIVSWKRIIAIIALGGSLALVISASKIAAVFAFMRFFPRQVADTYKSPGILVSLFGILCQLLGTMGLSPILVAEGSKGAILAGLMQHLTGAPYEYWEYDMSMSPVVFGIIIIAIYSFLKRPKRYSFLFTEHKKWIAWIVLFFFTWLTIEFILAKGLMYPYISKLPILSSLHVNPRYTAAFLFPMALIAVIIYNKWMGKLPGKKGTSVFLFVNVLTLIPLSTYFLIHEDLQDRSYNITESVKTYAAIRAGATVNITGIGNSSISNSQALDNHVSNIHPYDPIFGYFDEAFHPEFQVGSIWDISDGFYNMTNPSGYVFPEINNSRPFERIPVSEKTQLQAFAGHRDPGWKIPLYQQILDWVSGLSAACVTVFLSFFGLRSLFKQARFNRLPLPKE